MYTDDSLEFTTTCDHLSWKRDKSIPRRSETNGIAEREVRSVKEGTSTLVAPSRLDETWWEEAMECYSGRNSKKWEDNSYFHVLTVQQINRRCPSLHTTNPKRSYSNLLEDISGCLPGEEDDG